MSPEVDAAVDTPWAQGEMTVLGRLTSASNASFLVEMQQDDAEPVRCVHKPVAGERPLWDFPDGTLAEREYASFLISDRAGFDVVPPTTLVDGPFGPGMLQRWVDSEDLDPWVRVARPGRAAAGWCEVMEAFDQHDRPVVVSHADHPALRRIALFDAVINNSDRKGQHLLPVGDVVRGIDHGVSLSVDDKLRTILWGWAGAALTESERGLVTRARDLAEDLDELITVDEVLALQLRCELLLETGVLPEPQGGWPHIPWPPL